MAGKWSNMRENMVFDNKECYNLSIRGRFSNITLGTTPGDPNILATYVASKAPDAMTTAEELALANEGRSPEEIDMSRLMTVFPVGKFLKYVNPEFPEEPEFFDPQYDIVPEKIKDQCEEVIVPFMWSHQFEGKCKEGIYAIRSAEKKAKDGDGDSGAKGKTRYAASKITSYKKNVDLGWFVMQRRIPILVAPTFIDENDREQETYNTFGREGKLPIYTRPLRIDGLNPRVCISASEFVPAGSEFYLTFKLMDKRNKQALLEVLDYSAKVGMLQWRSSGKGTFDWTPADTSGHPIDEIPD